MYVRNGEAAREGRGPRGEERGGSSATKGHLRGAGQHGKCNVSGIVSCDSGTYQGEQGKGSGPGGEGGWAGKSW